MNAKHIIDSLRAHYLHTDQRDQWAFFEEFRAGTGYAKHAQSRLDALVLNLWPSKKFHSIAFEVKVTRGDFWKEVKDPMKRQMAFALSNMYYFATPPGLVAEHELPELCGLVEIDESGEVSIVRIAPARPRLNPDWRLVAAIARRQCRAEQEERCNPDHPVDPIETDPQLTLSLSS